MDDHLENARGLATGDLDDLRGRLLASWDAVIAGADAGAGVALDASGGGRRALADLGSWPERPVLAALMAQARGAAAESGTEADAAAGAPKADRSDAPAAEIVAALHDARERVAAALDEIAAEPELGLRQVPSVLGPLPVLTQIHAMGHELALAQLRVAPGARLPHAVADAGLAALVDVVGGLAYRQGLTVSAGAWEPDACGWLFRADAGGWRTSPGVAVPGVPGIEGRAELILGAPSGPTALPAQLARGQLRLHRVTGLMALAPLVDQVPGIPGGPLLRRAISMVGLFGRLPARR